jgi:multiple sugar transport system permease protein
MSRALRAHMPGSGAKAAKTVIGLAIGLLWFLPFVGVLVESIRPFEEVSNGWWRLDELHLTLASYVKIFSGTTLPMLGPLWNSFFSSVLGALIPILLGSMAAYAFARQWLPAKTVVIVVILCLMAIPGQMIAIPAFRRLYSLHLLDTYTGVILMNTVTSLPWIMFFMMNVIRMQDVQIEEAAVIDGASDYRIFRSVVLPQCGPSLISAGLLQFVWSWNTFFWPLVLIFSPKKMMVTQVIPMLRGQFYTDWGILTAGATLVMVVPIAVFLAFQRYYIQGSVGFAVDK